MHEVFAIEWIESEKGWGIRSDGASLHLSKEDLSTFIEDYWKQQPDEVQDIYSRPDGNSLKIFVSDKIYNAIEKSKNGISVWEQDWAIIQKENELFQKGDSITK